MLEIFISRPSPPSTTTTFWAQSTHSHHHSRCPALLWLVFRAEAVTWQACRLSWLFTFPPCYSPKPCWGCLDVRGCCWGCSCRCFWRRTGQFRWWHWSWNVPWIWNLSGCCSLKSVFCGWHRWKARRASEFSCKMWSWGTTACEVYTPYKINNKCRLNYLPTTTRPHIY